MPRPPLLAVVAAAIGLGVVGAALAVVGTFVVGLPEKYISLFMLDEGQDSTKNPEFVCRNYLQDQDRSSSLRGSVADLQSLEILNPIEP